MRCHSCRADKPMDAFSINESTGAPKIRCDDCRAKKNANGLARSWSDRRPGEAPFVASPDLPAWVQSPPRMSVAQLVGAV